MSMNLDTKDKIAVVGLGYVGLPLAVAFGQKTETLGYDIDEKRVNELREGRESTLEIDEELLKSANNSRGRGGSAF